MKALCFFFLAICCATLKSGTAFAGSPSPTSQQTSPASSTNTVNAHPQDAEHAAAVDGGKGQKQGKPSDGRQDNRKVSGKNHPRGPATTTKVRPKQPSNTRERLQPGNPTRLHQPGLDKSAVPTDSGLLQAEIGNTALPRRPPSVTRPSVPLHNDVRHRGANPPVVGGSAISNNRSSAAINGTAMHRRP